MNVPKGAVIAGVAGILVIVLVASLWPSGPRGIEVEAEAAKRRDIVSRVKATGEIIPEKKVEITAKVIGEITSLPVQEGDPVKAGDVLVEIEKDLYESSRDEAAAALKQTQAATRRMEVNAQLARQSLQRVKELHDRGFASTEELERAEAESVAASAELEAQTHAVDRARSALERAKDDLNRTTIRSPMNGTVIQLDKELGETVISSAANVPGSVIMTVADMSRLLVTAQVTEVDVVNVQVGQDVEIEVSPLGDDLQHGKVVYVATSGREDPALGVVRFEVKVELIDPDPALRPSMTAKVDILTNTRKDVVSVPIQSVVERRLDDEGHEVDRDDASVPETDVAYVVKGGKAHVAEVRTGAADVLHVEILDGLDEGDVVVTGPYRTLRTLEDDTSVAVKKNKESPDDESADDAPTADLHAGEP